MHRDRRPLAERVAFGAPYPDPVPKSQLLLEALLRQRPSGKGGADDAAFARAVDVVDKLLRYESAEVPAGVDDDAEAFAGNLVRALIFRLVGANELFKQDPGISSFDIGVELDRFDRAYDLVKRFQQAARASAARPFDAVLCDVDGVLWNWPSIEPIELEHGVVPGTLFAAAFAGHRLEPAITGLVTDAQWRAHVAEDLAESAGLTPQAASALVAAWSAMRPVPDEKVLALLELVREVVPVALVSNATDRLETHLADLGLASFVDMLVNTSRVGFAKPDPRLYAFAAERVGVPPERCLFVDDSAENVDAARAAGMRAVHFREFADLDEALRPLLADG